MKKIRTLLQQLLVVAGLIFLAIACNDKEKADQYSSEISTGHSSSSSQFFLTIDNQTFKCDSISGLAQNSSKGYSLLFHISKGNNSTFDNVFIISQIKKTGYYPITGGTAGYGTYLAAFNLGETAVRITWNGYTYEAIDGGFTITKLDTDNSIISGSYIFRMMKGYSINGVDTNNNITVSGSFDNLYIPAPQIEVTINKNTIYNIIPEYNPDKGHSEIDISFENSTKNFSAEGYYFNEAAIGFGLFPYQGKKTYALDTTNFYLVFKSGGNMMIKSGSLKVTKETTDSYGQKYISGSFTATCLDGYLYANYGRKENMEVTCKFKDLPLADRNYSY